MWITSLHLTALGCPKHSKWQRRVTVTAKAGRSRDPGGGKASSALRLAPTFPSSFFTPLDPRGSSTAGITPVCRCSQVPIGGSSPLKPWQEEDGFLQSTHFLRGLGVCSHELHFPFQSKAGTLSWYVLKYLFSEIKLTLEVQRRTAAALILLNVWFASVNHRVYPRFVTRAPNTCRALITVPQL